jgi:hypothetical protein
LRQHPQLNFKVTIKSTGGIEMANVGSNKFKKVTFPLVIENRFFMLDQSTKDDKWSVLSLQDGNLITEVLNNKPQENTITEVITSPTGVIIVSDLKSDKFLYKIRPGDKNSSIFGTVGGEEKEIKITDKEIRVGTNSFRNNCVESSPVGICVGKNGEIGLGGNLPQEIQDIFLPPQSEN